jgi:hypothetical protein
MYKCGQSKSGQSRELINLLPLVLELLRAVIIRPYQWNLGYANVLFNSDNQSLNVTVLQIYIM